MRVIANDSRHHQDLIDLWLLFYPTKPCCVFMALAREQLLTTPICRHADSELYPRVSAMVLRLAAASFTVWPGKAECSQQEATELPHAKQQR
jgi:hypothetical protein